MKHHQEGLTLLELVMAIVIISILAFIAIPRFISLSKDAERATVEYQISSFSSALNMYSMKQLSSGLTVTPHNPFDDLSSASNYAGAFPDIDGTNCPPGYWAYQSGDAILNGGWKVIAYRPKSTLRQTFTWGGMQWIILEEKPVADSNGKVIGLTLTDYPPIHQW